jgi:hypothetical protein
MSEIKDWDESAAGNSSDSPHGYPEGMARSGVNDSDRETQAAIRRYYEDPSFLNLLADFTVARLSTASITVVHDVTPTDATGKFDIGARVRISISGSSEVYGFVSSIVPGPPTTTVLVALDGTDIVPVGANRCEIIASRAAHSQIAYSPLGTTRLEEPPEVPSIDMLGDGVILDMGEGEGFDADMLDGQHGQYYEDLALVAKTSLLANPEFEIWQRGATVDQSSPVYKNDNGAYGPDQWILLMGDGGSRPAAGSGVVDLTKELITDSVSRYALKVAGNASVSPTAERVALFQPLEAADSVVLRGKSVSLSFWAKRTGGSAFNELQCAIVEWTGSLDTLSSRDPVLTWNATGANPTMKPSFTIDSSVSGDGPFTLSTSWEEFKLQNIIVSANCSNLCVMIWADDDSWSNGDEFWLTGVSLQQSVVAVPYSRRKASDEWNLCHRFFNSTFDIDVSPQQNIGNIRGAITAMGAGSGGAFDGQAFFEWAFAGHMLAAPTVTIYSPLSAFATAYNSDDATETTIVVTLVNTRAITMRSFEATDEGDELVVHATVDAAL